MHASHHYAFGARDLVRLLGPTLLVVLGFAAVMHLGAALAWWPAPRPTLDVDRTLLIQKVEAARAPQDATVLLIGDSSCLMDVSALSLGERLGAPVLNLGTLSYLDLAAYAQLLREYDRAHPRQLRTVVLLMHPEALRRNAPEAYHARLLDALLRGTDVPAKPGWHAELMRLLGLSLWRDRLLCRVLPTPLGGAFGRAYGFSADLERDLIAQRGSAVEPDRQPFRGNAEYRLAQPVEQASRIFREAVPGGARLFVGITPVPAGFVDGRYPKLHQALLETWGRWLNADMLLSGLPATLPDAAFAKTTHLTADGARAYTEWLARELIRVR